MAEDPFDKPMREAAGDPPVATCLVCRFRTEVHEAARAHYKRTGHSTWTIPSAWLGADGWTLESVLGGEDG